MEIDATREGGQGTIWQNYHTKRSLTSWQTSNASSIQGNSLKHTRQFAEAVKGWLTALHRTVDDVHGFSFETALVGDIVFNLEAWCIPTYDVTVKFKDGSKEESRFSLVGGRRAAIWRDVLEAVRW